MLPGLVIMTEAVQIFKTMHKLLSAECMYVCMSVTSPWAWEGEASIMLSSISLSFYFLSTDKLTEDAISIAMSTKENLIHQKHHFTGIMSKVNDITSILILGCWK